MPKPKGSGSSAPALQGADPVPEADVGTVPASQQPEGGPPAKKRRNNNPGVRVQGGRVYDSETGTTCHQCRQKTVETKAKCTACTLYFCPKCLGNRYQEGVEAANAAGDWRCPRCRGECNCSNCRKKQGMQATGQLAQIAKKAGFNSVRDLLVKNPNAKAIHLPRAPSGAGTDEAGAAPAPRKRSAKRKAAGDAAAAAEQELIDDEALPPRVAPMPEAHPLAVHKAAAVGGSRRQRGVGAWAVGLPEVVAVPEGQAGAELAVVLEFLQVFGPKLQMRATCLAAFAAELLQPAVGGDVQPLCPSAEESLVGAVHCRLLEVVRAYWNVKGAVGAAAWHRLMRAYYAASQLGQAQALALRWQHGPPAVAGEIFHRPPAAVERAEEGEVEAGGGAAEPELAAEEGAAALGAAPAAQVDYPGGSYWAVPAEARVGMLHALVHDALECAEMREMIEGSMGDAMDEEKERRQQLAGMRKEAREAIARERDQQIALLVASADASGLTLEQQQQMLEEARQRAEAAATTAAAAKVKALTEKVHPPTVRAAVAGSDRDGRRYLQLQVAVLLTGEGGVVVQSCGADATCGAADAAGSSADAPPREGLACYPSSSLPEVAAALHPQGRCEGPLRAALAHAFKLPTTEPAAAGGDPATQPAATVAADEEAAEEAASAEAPAAAQPEAAPAGGQRKRKAAGRGKSSSISPSVEASSVGDVPAPAGKHSRQGSEEGSSAERAAPKRQRAGAPRAAPAPAKPAAGTVAKRGVRRSARSATPAAGEPSASLPLRVDDMLTA